MINSKQKNIEKLGLFIGLAIFVLILLFNVYLIYENIQIRNEIKKTEQVLNGINEIELQRYEKLDIEIEKKIDSLKVVTLNEIKSLQNKSNKELREIAND